MAKSSLFILIKQVISTYVIMAKGARPLINKSIEKLKSFKSHSLIKKGKNNMELI